MTGQMYRTKNQMEPRQANVLLYYRMNILYDFEVKYTDSIGPDEMVEKLIDRHFSPAIFGPKNSAGSIGWRVIWNSLGSPQTTRSVLS